MMMAVTFPVTFTGGALAPLSFSGGGTHIYPTDAVAMVPRKPKVPANGKTQRPRNHYRLVLWHYCTSTSWSFTGRTEHRVGLTLPITLDLVCITGSINKSFVISHSLVRIYFETCILLLHCGSCLHKRGTAVFHHYRNIVAQIKHADDWWKNCYLVWLCKCYMKSTMIDLTVMTCVSDVPLYLSIMCYYHAASCPVSQLWSGTEPSVTSRLRLKRCRRSSAPCRQWRRCQFGNCCWMTRSAGRCSAWWSSTSACSCLASML